MRVYTKAHSYVNSKYYSNHIRFNYLRGGPQEVVVTAGWNCHKKVKRLSHTVAINR